MKCFIPVHPHDAFCTHTHTDITCQLSYLHCPITSMTLHYPISDQIVLVITNHVWEFYFSFDYVKNRLVDKPIIFENFVRDTLYMYVWYNYTDCLTINTLMSDKICTWRDKAAVILLRIWSESWLKQYFTPLFVS